MTKRMLLVPFIAICAMALLIGMVAIASADDGTSTTTTATTGSTDSTTTTVSTTTTSSTTTTTEKLFWWKVNIVDMTATGLIPSFISVGDRRLAWTGRLPGGYSTMYVYDVAGNSNNEIPEALPGNYYNPSSDGALVVYQGGRAGGYDDIYMYDTGNGLVQQITHNSDPGDGNDWNPRIDEGRIVWEKHMIGPGAKTGIYLYDMDEGTVTCVLAGDEYRSPDVWGDYVVCVKSAASGNGTEIILYNLKTKVIKSIAASTNDNEHPRIDSGHVVWSSGDIPTAILYPWSTYQIKLYDIAGGTTTALSSNALGNSNPSIKGENIAWEQAEPSGIVGYNYVTHFTGTYKQEGDILKSPEVDDSGIAFYGQKSLYFMAPEANGPVFPDVGSDDPYAVAIAAMAEKKIIEGYDTGFFGPTDPVTRQQFAKMVLLTMAQWNPSVYTPTLHDAYNFTDSASIEQTAGELYAYHYVAKAALTGLTLGYPDGTFRPLSNISRQQVITMIVRAGSQVLQTPPADWQGVLSYVNREHGPRILIAEYNGLLNGIVGPRWALAGWDTSANATRGEVAQMLYNLLGKLQAVN